MNWWKWKILNRLVKYLREDEKVEEAKIFDLQDFDESEPEANKTWIIKASWHPSKVIGNLDGKRFMKDTVKVSATARVVWRSDPASPYHLIDGKIIIEFRTFTVKYNMLQLDEIIRKTYKISGANGEWEKEFTFTMPAVPTKIVIAEIVDVKMNAGRNWHPCLTHPIYLHYETIGEAYEDTFFPLWVQVIPRYENKVVVNDKYVFPAPQQKIPIKAYYSKHDWSWILAKPSRIEPTHVTLEAIPDKEHEFDSWDDGSTDTIKEVSTSVHAKGITAYFKKKKKETPPILITPHPTTPLKIISYWIRRHVKSKKTISATFYISWRGGKPPFKIILETGDGNIIEKISEEKHVILHHDYEARKGENLWNTQVTIIDSIGNKAVKEKQVKTTILR